MATAIVGSFIVGKKPTTHSLEIAKFFPLQGSNMNLIHKLFTILTESLWTTCGWSVDQQWIVPIHAA